MRKVLIGSSLLLAAVMVSTNASSQDNVEERPNSIFHQIDKDGDGKLDQFEYLEYWWNVAEEIDADADGIITVEEITARAKRHHASMDANSDGTVCVIEYIGFPEPEGAKGLKPAEGKLTIFEAHDANGDGFITIEEFYAARLANFMSTAAAEDEIEVDALVKMYVGNLNKIKSRLGKEGEAGITIEEWLSGWVTMPDFEDGGDDEGDVSGE